MNRGLTQCDDGRPAIAGALCPSCNTPATVVNAAIIEGVQFVGHTQDPEGSLGADDGPWPERIEWAGCGLCGEEVIYPGSGSPLDG